MKSHPYRDLATPALVIDIGKAKRNIAAAIETIGSPNRWRPHVKTAKVAPVMALYLDAGIHQFKCATLLEASVLADCRSAADGSGPADILVAHHLFGPALARLDALAKKHPSIHFSTLVESSDQVASIPASVSLFADLDLGMHRTGLDVEDLAEIQAIARAAGARFRGLHAYDGHRHEEDLVERERLAHAGYDRVLRAYGDLKNAGLDPGEIITSGTPAYPAALTHRSLAEVHHRVSPGTVVYHDLRTKQQLPDHAIEFAATVITRVASLPSTDLFTVDAGSKAIEAASPALIASALELPHAIALRQSEEHTVFRCDPAQRPSRGDLLRLVPGHVCPTVNLASECLLVEDDKPLGFAAVAARGHARSGASAAGASQ
jgi:D-serine deaminase-like pyridoxal phosphate-dependent protein